MVPVAVGDVAGKGRGQDERVILPHRAHDIAEDAIVSPLLMGFVNGFGEAVIGDGGEELLGAGILIGQQQLVGADQPQRIVAFAGHGILAAFAAGEGHDGRARTDAARFVSEHAAVLVVGMGDDEHEAAPGVELAQCLRQAVGAAIFRESLSVRAKRRSACATEQPAPKRLNRSRR